MPASHAKLATVSTATLTTALFKRGLRNQFVQDVHPLNAGLGTMVGEAYTLRYIPAREDLNPISVFRDRAHPQRLAIEECPPGAVLVIGGLVVLATTVLGLAVTRVCGTDGAAATMSNGLLTAAVRPGAVARSV